MSGARWWGGDVARFNRILTLTLDSPEFRMFWGAAPNEQQPIGALFRTSPTSSLGNRTVRELADWASNGYAAGLRTVGLNPEPPPGDYRFRAVSASGGVLVEGSFTLTARAGTAGVPPPADPKPGEPDTRLHMRLIESLAVEIPELVSGGAGLNLSLFELFDSPANPVRVETWAEVRDVESGLGVFTTSTDEQEFVRAVTVRVPWDARITGGMDAVIDGLDYRVNVVNVVRPYRELELQLSGVYRNG